MKKILLLLLFIPFFSCSDSDDSSGNNSTDGQNYKQLMRDFVVSISQNAKADNPGFIVIPQNGIELVTQNGEENGSPDSAYLNAIDGNGQEDLFYGYDTDDQATPTETNAYLRHFLDISRQAGKTILVTDYCSTPSKMTDSYNQNASAGYISYAAPERALNVIPTTDIHNENTVDITSLSLAKNFTFFANPEGFSSKAEFVSTVASTNYDAIIIDLFYDGEQLTATDVNQLKYKANGGKRLVICYMSIGEAEDYRYYWDTGWTTSPPSWLAAENPDWPGNFKVRYWDENWQQYIFGSADSYLSRIKSSGFDGVYLDIIDAFEYFENNG
ncbi:endo alpha-1,4 polygalactosaminidase [Flavobacterium silvaticum]|nr:endo alpha-1,4 polygalactosaminidase [Flavobacterium silvaticum]